MRTQTYSGETASYVPSFTAPSQAEAEGADYFVPAAPQRITPSGLLRRIDWTAVGAGALVYAVAFAAWVWLAR